LGAAPLKFRIENRPKFDGISDNLTSPEMIKILASGKRHN